MTAVLIELQAIGSAATEDIEFIDDLESFGAEAIPGCGDDNPYQ